MRTQARGLAKAVADEVVEKVVVMRPPWRWFPARWPGVLNGADAEAGDTLDPPWPDVIVTCGRRSAILGLAVKKQAGGKPLLVHLQDPLTSLRDFDLVVAMEHDDIKGPKVLKVLTTLHDMTPERLSQAHGDWEARLSALPRPLIGVLLGGPTRHSAFAGAEARELIARLAALRAKTGAGAVIVPSRRTPDEVLQVFVEAGRSDPGLWAWDRSGDNPYLGVLARADRFVITGDSVSMISEALATTKPVEVFAGNLRKRHVGFVEKLNERGLARWFDGEVSEPRPRPALDATAEAAAAVKKLLAARR
ncbi:mitochondrial fission ELM1 family protein [Phenylobacterium soli]|uniref:Nucleoside-diphosphate sugar epimerase n=1 Tax=Phenylobacterium soli TaxID=2170551 RepID=A0A328AEQ2_9CAUL|nr:mitochondrial fission ELM1 family protein [Phenylobacterium soli]RAK51864.1 hypothetical protein DJ017_18795 [Phenylobacterium soli]